MQTPIGTLVRAAFILGMGLSMFFDGIVLHQLLQWHHMVSQWYAPTTLAAMELNTRWDGLFHLIAWVLTVAGVVLLWRAIRACPQSVPSSVVAGALIAGWGTFNIVENLLNHFILGVHHVREATSHILLYDVGFLLLFGVVLATAGWWLMRRGLRRVSQAGADMAGQAA